jgi:hypothetical protein
VNKLATGLVLVLLATSAAQAAEPKLVVPESSSEVQIDPCQAALEGNRISLGVAFTNSNIPAATLVRVAYVLKDPAGKILVTEHQDFSGSFKPGLTIDRLKERHTFTLPKGTLDTIECLTDVVNYADGTSWRRGDLATPPPIPSAPSAASTASPMSVPTPNMPPRG